MTHVFVMTIHEREFTSSPWTQTGLIAKEPFTEQDWQERVVDAREFFEELGGIESHTGTHTIVHVSQNHKRKVVYQMQEKSVREQQIKSALTEALTRYTPDAIIEILKDNFAKGCFCWRKGIESLDQIPLKELRRWNERTAFLNQTTLKELQHVIERWPIK